MQRGGDNPVWQVSTLPQYERSAEKWISDWNRYAAPVLYSIVDTSGVIEFCQKALQYKNNPWVKSDGFRNYEISTWTAMLMAKERRFDDAKNLLLKALNANETEAPRASLREARRAQLQRAFDWIEQQRVQK